MNAQQYIEYRTTVKEERISAIVVTALIVGLLFLGFNAGRTYEYYQTVQSETK